MGLLVRLVQLIDFANLSVLCASLMQPAAPVNLLNDSSLVLVPGCY